jgi:hypothetical protein
LHIVETAFRVLCLLGALKIIVTRVITVYYLVIRFTEGGFSTQDRLENPQWYIGRKLTPSDWVSLLSYRLFPDIKEVSDYKTRTIMLHPHGIYESDRILKYLRKTLPLSILALSFLIPVTLGIWEEHMSEIIVVYLRVFLGISVICYLAKKMTGVSRVLRLRIKIISSTFWEVFSLYTFGLFRREKNITFRKLVLIDALVILILILEKLIT